MALFKMDVEAIIATTRGTLDVEAAQAIILVEIEGKNEPTLVEVIRKKRARFEALFS